MIYVSAIILKIINDNFKVIFCPNVCKVGLCFLCFGQCGPLVVFSIKATLLCPMEITRVPTKQLLMHASQIVLKSTQFRAIYYLNGFCSTINKDVVPIPCTGSMLYYKACTGIYGKYDT